MLTWVLAYWLVGLATGVAVCLYARRNTCTFKPAPVLPDNAVGAVLRRWWPVLQFLVASWIVPPLVVLAGVFFGGEALGSGLRWCKRRWSGAPAAMAPAPKPALCMSRCDKVRTEHLCLPLTQHEIERRELVRDPMGAVPSLPFGHLHFAWQAFVQPMQAQDQLWSFLAPLPHPGGAGLVMASGYAIVRRNQLRSVFVVGLKGLARHGQPLSASAPAARETVPK